MKSDLDKLFKGIVGSHRGAFREDPFAWLRLPNNQTVHVREGDQFKVVKK